MKAIYMLLTVLIPVLGFSQDAVIDVQKKYGIVADGNTDNAAALMKLRDDLAGKGKPHFVLYFPAGEIHYSNNRWLYGIESFELIGDGSIFRSIYSGSDEAFQRPFFVGEMFQNNTLSYLGTKEYETADRFASVNAGSTIIQLSTSLNNYAAGNRVLLYTGNYADSGYPPPASAEWHEIESVNGQTITLKRPIERNYPGDVFDNQWITGGGCGKPRILNLDRPQNVYCKYAKFAGITFGNATGGGMGNVIFPAERLEMIRCRGEGFFWPSETRVATFEDMDVNKVEFDKLVNIVICNRVTFKNSANGGGTIDRIVLNDCQAGESVRFDSRYVEIRNSHIRGNADPDPWIASLADHPARNPIRRLTIENVTFSSGDQSLSDAHINVAPFNSIRIGCVSGKKILTSDFSLVKTIEPGTTVLFNEDGSDGGTVTSITYDGLEFVIEGDWNYMPPIGSLWRWCYVKEVIDLGGNRVLDNKKLWHGNSIRWKGNQSTGGVKEMHLTEKDFKWPGNILVDVYGYIESIDFYPSKRYGDAGATLNIQDIGGQNLFQTILTSMAANHVIIGGWVKQIYLNTFNITGGVISELLPKFEVVVRWRPF
jgi:hypothetical protein